MRNFGTVSRESHKRDRPSKAFSFPLPKHRPTEGYNWPCFLFSCNLALTKLHISLRNCWGSLHPCKCLFPDNRKFLRICCTAQVPSSDRTLILKYGNGYQRQEGWQDKFPKGFKDMCDLMFEIARDDNDMQGNKAKYLNKHIAAWIYPKDELTKDVSKDVPQRRKHIVKNVNSNSNSTSRKRIPTPPPEEQYAKQSCYRCALPLCPGHAGHGEGIHATCRYCSTKGHVKEACRKLGRLPARNYKRGVPVTEDMCDPRAKCIGHKCSC